MNPDNKSMSGYEEAEWRLSREASAAIDGMVLALTKLDASTDLSAPVSAAICSGLEAIRSAARAPEESGSGSYLCSASALGPEGTSLTLRRDDPHGIELAIQMDPSFRMHGLFYVCESEPSGIREHVFDIDSASGEPALCKWQDGKLIRYPAPAIVSSFWTQAPALDQMDDLLTSGGGSIASWQPSGPASAPPSVPAPPPEAGAPVCAHCGAAIRATARHCPACGARRASSAPPAQSKHCIQCGGELSPGARFCKACGTPAGKPPEPKEKALTPKFCSNCGATRRKHARFCGTCGVTFPNAPASWQPAAAPTLQPTPASGVSRPAARATPPPRKNDPRRAAQPGPLPRWNVVVGEQLPPMEQVDL